ncbi:HAD-IA family hydrolase [Streptomyces sp. SL13]|uniref:HAD-IA family hydrolase n=1 Tax=Streptantibioticus silvisoli TaxID=2705255 RepID=A0AA90H9W5_9ACTN|nr:HAD-IA family hydrolase [Streptantibioticus silvisoli]MDI5973900.1 HAD-IA family hydrolase [Streptantibioticus silvisoli]
MSTPRTGLILDFGGVLTTGLAPCTFGFDRRSGLAEGTVLSVIGADPAGRAVYERLERGEVTQREWNEVTAALLGVEPDNLLGRVLSDLRPQPELIGAARLARAAGVRVGIFSNSVGPEPFNPYDGYDLPALCDTMLISEEHGARKPEPVLYATMLARMRLPGDACVFVDDTAQNLPPARELGIATVHHTDPAATVAALEELLGMRLRG